MSTHRVTSVSTTPRQHPLLYMILGPPHSQSETLIVVGRVIQNIFLMYLRYFCGRILSELCIKRKTKKEWEIIDLMKSKFYLLIYPPFNLIFTLLVFSLFHYLFIFSSKSSSIIKFCHLWNLTPVGINCPNKIYKIYMAESAVQMWIDYWE